MKYIKSIISEWFLMVCLYLSIFCLLDCDVERGNGIMGIFVLYLIFGVRSKIYFIGVGLLTILFGLSFCTPLPQKCSTSINVDLNLLLQSGFPMGFLFVLSGLGIILFSIISSFGTEDET